MNEELSKANDNNLYLKNKLREIIKTNKLITDKEYNEKIINLNDDLSKANDNNLYLDNKLNDTINLKNRLNEIV